MEVTVKFERIELRYPEDALVVRSHARNVATQVGFSRPDVNRIQIAVMELCSNVLKHAGRGWLTFEPIDASGGRCGIRIVVSDEGPGIPDVPSALEVGFSTTGTLGTGLPVVKELMDSFDLATEVGRGSTITVEKWVS